MFMRTFNLLLCAMALVAFVACGDCGAKKGGACGAACEKSECVGGECAHDACDKAKCDKVDECRKSACAADAVIENIMSRRSIRKYKEQAVPREVLDEIMLCGINAPNGQNKQSWEVRVVESPALQGEIKAAMAAAGGERAAGCFYNAPVWVFIARDKDYDFSAYDCGLLAENIMLSANAMGVGSVCLGSPVRFILTSPDADKVLGKLGFAPGYELALCIALGYPDEVPAAKPRDMGKVKYVE
jgi:nitroreductase